MNHFFAFFSRLRYIRRWSLMHNTLPENVAEHALMTAVLAHALAVIRRDMLSLPADPEACAVCALYHDVSEIFTGDMPTPVKYWSPELRSAMREVEESSVDKLLSYLPEELKPAYSEAMRPESENVAVLVHAADKLSAYIKCAEELRGGNAEFAKAAAQTLEKLEEMKLPEVEIFLRDFFPSFQLTLDELG